MRGLTEKRVLITGAAGGIGLATARRFQEEGASLCLVDVADMAHLRDGFRLDTTFITADLCSEEGLAAVKADIAAHGLDVLINNAGITRDASIGKMDREMWDQVIAVNLTAVFELAQIAAAHFKEQGSGVILNAASVVAHYGNFGQANYVASKAGVIGMTKTLAKELGKYGVRVNAVAPGFVLTPMVEAMPEKVREAIVERPALKRMGKPEEMAGVYAFLASDDASYITGTCINADGGLVIG